MIQTFERGVRSITLILLYIGMGMLAALTLVGAFDVIGRYVFNAPFKGAYEVSEVLLAGTVFFCMAYTTSVRGHVALDILVMLFSPRIQGLIRVSTCLISIAIVALIGWQGADLAMRSWESHRVIDVIRIPLAPFQLFVPLGALAMCLELCIQLFRFIAQMRKGD